MAKDKESGVYKRPCGVLPMAYFCTRALALSLRFPRPNLGKRPERILSWHRGFPEDGTAHQPASESETTDQMRSRTPLVIWPAG
jgi:hypothetical protein